MRDSRLLRFVTQLMYFFNHCGPPCLIISFVISLFPGLLLFFNFLRPFVLFLPVCHSGCQQVVARCLSALWQDHWVPSGQAVPCSVRCSTLFIVVLCHCIHEQLSITVSDCSLLWLPFSVNVTDHLVNFPGLIFSIVFLYVLALFLQPFRFVCFGSFSYLITFLSKLFVC